MGRYEAELYKKNSAVDVLLDSMSMSSNSKKEEAAECLMKVLYKKFEECFASVAIEMNLMITKSARILSRHLRQHFVRSLIASESE
jgi:translation initiation factor 2 alpha subunit (eIF-2alpha)